MQPAAVAVGGGARPAQMMQPIDAVKTCLMKFNDANGRASRSEYWWFFLFTIIVSQLCSIADGFIGVMVAGNGILYLISSIALLIPGIGVAVRRFHDQGRSGWWFLTCFFLIGFIVLIFDGEAGDNAYGASPTNVIS